VNVRSAARLDAARSDNVCQSLALKAASHASALPLIASLTGWTIARYCWPASSRVISAPGVGGALTIGVATAATVEGAAVADAGGYVLLPDVEQALTSAAVMTATTAIRVFMASPSE